MLFAAHVVISFEKNVSWYVLIVKRCICMSDVFSSVFISQTSEDIKAKELICTLCRQFYSLGWVTGTGGSISLKTSEYVLNILYRKYVC